jgi:hypothetical protein
MDEFEEQYVEIVAMMGKVPEPLRQALLAGVAELHEHHAAEVLELEEAHAVAAAETRKAFDKEQHQLEKDLQDLQDAADAPTTIEEALQCMWDHSDGRKLIERAYKADPKFSRIEIDYMGGHLISGELRDQAKLAKEIEEKKKGIN